MTQSQTCDPVRVEFNSNGSVSLNQIGGGPILHFSSERWQEFVRKVKEGAYDLPK